MSFIWPNLLMLLVAVPLLVMLYIRLDRQRQRAAAQFVSAGFAQSGSTRRNWRRHIPTKPYLTTAWQMQTCRWGISLTPQQPRNGGLGSFHDHRRRDSWICNFVVHAVCDPSLKISMQDFDAGKLTGFGLLS